MRQGRLAALVCTAFLVPPAAAAAAPLRCSGGIDHARRTPVMLVTGTGASGDEIHAATRDAWAAYGAPVCWVNFPHHTTGDIQRSAAILVRGLRAMHRRAGRKLAVFGISQGGLLPRVALTYWPGLRAIVDDVIAAAGTQHGTTSAGFADCRRRHLACIPAGWQQARGSDLLQALNARPDETPGPTAWTTVRSATDRVVVPQAGAALAGAGNVLVQRVCPGRATSHAGVLMDSVTWAAIADAIGHPGPARSSRLPADTCAHRYGRGLDEARTDAILDAAGGLAASRVMSEPKVLREPALWPRLRERRAASRQASEPLMSADTSRPGRIDLYLGDVSGSTGRFFELVGGQRTFVGEVTIGDQSPVKLVDALTWSCTRRTRRLVADVVHPDGTTASAHYEVRTPGCRDRLTLAAPRSAAPGTRAAVTVVDRWKLGDVTPRLCVRSPTRHRSCRPVALAGAARRELHVELTRDGVWRLDLALGRAHVRRTLRVGLGGTASGPSRRPVMLVTGDSMVQGIDAILGDRLHTSAHVVSDFRPGSAIGHDWDHWPAFAAREARRFRPRVTVISIGITEGYPMRLPDGSSVQCCGPRWRAEYRRRTLLVMRSLVRGGRGHVLWLTLPASDDPRRNRILTILNAEAERAAARVAGVVMVHVDRVFTPGGRFRRTMRYRGARRVVRADDGIHFTLAGMNLASDLVLRAFGRLEL